MAEEKRKKPKFGAEEFGKYAQSIVSHPNYSGMPDVIGSKGQIQWEAPSNRSSGEFQYTHQRRLEWWRAKAKTFGIDPYKDKVWISRTAKEIHPFKKKPCKSCGQWLSIEYVYPAANLIRRLRALPAIPNSFEFSPTEDIQPLLTRIVETCGADILLEMPQVLSTSHVKVPSLGSKLDTWLTYLRKSYIPAEPKSLLSPGAMSNAPDRLDGFHSFNRCCRGTADTGRSSENLKTYVTDRRVFEYWVDGDWVAANDLMGHVRTNKHLTDSKCFNWKQPGTHPTPCHADHIGPISLGFSHRPQFQLLCGKCNSAKNNRMYASDVRLLLAAEARGEQVVSWFARDVWNFGKNKVGDDDEKALRLSKMMRDNRHHFMALLQRISTSQHLTFLCSLLHLDAADHNITFEGVREKNHLTDFDKEKKTPRTTEYAAEQKARRIRVAFASLKEYWTKENRNVPPFDWSAASQLIDDALTKLDRDRTLRLLNNKLSEALEKHTYSDAELREVATSLSQFLGTPNAAIATAKGDLVKAMHLVAKSLMDAWESDRFKRS